MQDLTEHLISSQTIASGGMLNVKRDQVRLPNGNTSQREYVVHPGAVVVVPWLPNGNVILEKQFRYPLHQVFIELPAGKIDHDEDILLCAQRELLEETGYVAREWTHLTTTWPCIGYADERIEYFLARGLSHQGSQLDDGEFLEVIELPLTEALEWVRQGKISDSKTIVGLFWLEKTLNGWSV